MSGIGKDIVVGNLVEKFEGTETAIVTDYRGLKVDEITELRTRLREIGVEYKVTKNTLAGLAAEQGQLTGLKQFLTGPTAVSFSESDPVSSARILTDFLREHPALKIKGGTFGKEVLTAEQVALWAVLPGRDELLAKVAAGVKAPLSNLVFTLKGIMTKFLYTLEAIKEKKG